MDTDNYEMGTHWPILPGDGAIIHNDIQCSEEKVYVLEVEKEFLEMFEENLSTLSFSPQIIDKRYVHYKAQRVIVSGISSSLERNVRNDLSSFFYFNERLKCHCFTDKAKMIISELVVGYDILSQNRIYYSHGDDPNDIVFLDDDRNWNSPKLLRVYGKGRYQDIFKQLRKLLQKLMDEYVDSLKIQFRSVQVGSSHHIFSHSIEKFMEELDYSNSEFDFLKNHPALWRAGAGVRYATLAVAWFASPESQYNILNRSKTIIKLSCEGFNNWKEELHRDKDLKSFFEESSRFEEYEGHVLDLIKFQRNTYLHYNEPRGFGEVASPLPNIELEEKFNVLFPELMASVYKLLFDRKFRFKL